MLFYLQAWKALQSKTAETILISHYKTIWPYFMLQNDLAKKVNWKSKTKMIKSKKKKYVLIHEISSAPSIFVSDVVWLESSIEGMAGEV